MIHPREDIRAANLAREANDKVGRVVLVFGLAALSIVALLFAAL